ncbi:MULTISPECIES: peptidoglycan-binding protein [Streptacidiphilus]|uniref:Peptidoglycan-binding protein n=1 Tax=Streptacidiphilus cavernicola TaxID=3342716 RepID=A0ABV6UFK4_9ACTN|nr:peptidoglycan-binding domain-containing protein [Streptacidiphilus jeojiense]
MVGQICGRCGLALSSGGCGCRPDDAETAVLPVIGGPELVRPYVHPADAADPVDPAEAAHLAAEAAEAAEAAGASATSGELLPAARYLPATSRLPEPRNDALPVLRTSPLPAVRHRAAPPAKGRRRRRGLLMAAGALAVAGLGTVAAALPHMLNSDTTDQSLPAPGVTVAMASSGPDDATSDAPSATAGSASSSAAASAAATRRAAVAQTSAARSTASSSPTPAATPSRSSSPSASTAPSSAASASASTTASASPALASASTTLQLGDSGSAVSTLQSQLRALWVDPGLKVDGNYGSRTERDVATFQIWFGVQGDPQGVYGPNSQAMMAQQLQAQNR